jgi:adenine deaminase
MFDGDVAICDDMIVGVGDVYDGREVLDLQGLTLVPGFIDTHLHVESSLVTPFEFDRCVTPLGVTTAICDPHEIANVIGAPGVRYFQEAVGTHADGPARATVLLRAVDGHGDLGRGDGRRGDRGADGTPVGHRAGGVHELPRRDPRDPEAMAKLRLFEGGHIDGHCPLLSGPDLNAYIAAGIRRSMRRPPRRRRGRSWKGMRVLIREGSVSKDLEALQPVLTERTSPYMCLCTDDRNPLDIAEEGHLDHMIRRLIAMGAPPLAVYRAASLSAAEAFGLKDRGLIAPGKRADIVALDGLASCKAQYVWAGGRLVSDAAFAGRGTVAPGGPQLRHRATAQPRQFPRARQPGGDGRHRHHRGQDHHRTPARDDPDRGWRQAPRYRRATCCASR